MAYNYQAGAAGQAQGKMLSYAKLCLNKKTYERVVKANKRAMRGIAVYVAIFMALMFIPLFFLGKIPMLVFEVCFFIDFISIAFFIPLYFATFGKEWNAYVKWYTKTDRKKPFSYEDDISHTDAIEVAAETDSKDKDVVEVVVNIDSKREGGEKKSISYILPMGATYTDLYKRLSGDGFMATEEGGNEVWVLLHDTHFCLFSYYTKSKKYEEDNLWKKLDVICKKTNCFRLAYFNNPIDWSNYIVNYYHNDGQTICHEGWADVISYCHSLCTVVKYQDDNCRFYELNEKSRFDATIDGKRYRYELLISQSESRIHFAPIGKYEKEFSIVENIKYPDSSKNDGWKAFCNKLIEEIESHNTNADNK